MSVVIPEGLRARIASLRGWDTLCLPAGQLRELLADYDRRGAELDRLRKIENAARTYFTVRGPAVITAARALQEALALPPGVVPEFPAAPEFKAES